VIESLVWIGIGLVILVVGGEVLLRGAVLLAEKMNLTPAIIGLTVVAAGTSVPELAVSALAAWKGSTDIAIGNVVGSNIGNVMFVLGISAMVRPLLVTGNAIKLEYPVMAIVTLMYVAVAQDTTINRLDGVLFLIVYVCFTAYLVSLVRDNLKKEELEGLEGEVRELSGDGAKAPGSGRAIGLIAVGIVLLAGGAHATVTGAIGLAEILGLSERTIGLTVVAIGTSLPEIVTSMVSAYRGRTDIAIGNVIGSNLFNILGILGLSSLLAPLSVSPAMIASDHWWLLGVTILLFPLMRSGMRIGRLEGLFAMAVYGVYVALLVRSD
jgi:cation:H+ antiporter